MNKLIADIPRAGKRLFIDSLKVSLDLYKIMVPLIILVKILKEFDLIKYAAAPLAPFMEMVGLPAKMGLVWATAIIVNLYSAIVVYASLAAQADPLTTAQITVLATMMLIAHNLPLECKIAQKCGVGFSLQFIIRMLAALLCGLLLNIFFTRFSLYQDPSVMRFAQDAGEASLAAWVLSQAKGLGAVFLIIMALMTMMKILTKLRITELCNFLLRPVLRLVGVGKNAATITVIGLTLGIAYGGGLIIHEVKTGRVGKNDVFSSLTLMGLSHALIEDTLLMSLLGAHMAGTFWGRLVFSLAVVAILARLYKWKNPEPEAEQAGTVS